MVKLQKMQFHGFYFSLEMVRRDKAGIKFSSHINCNEKNMRSMLMLSSAFEKGTTQTLAAAGNAVKSTQCLDDESFL